MMDMTCRCKMCSPTYVCVACKVKRGDYQDWMEYEERQAKARAERHCFDCGKQVAVGPRCYRCAQLKAWRLTA